MEPFWVRISAFCFSSNSKEFFSSEQASRKIIVATQVMPRKRTLKTFAVEKTFSLCVSASNHQPRKNFFLNLLIQMFEEEDEKNLFFIQNSDRLTEKLHRLENERSSLNLQIQVLTDKLELQRDTIHEYEQLQHRPKFKYHNPTSNSTNFYHPHASFIHRVRI